MKIDVANPYWTPEKADHVKSGGAGEGDGSPKAFLRKKGKPGPGVRVHKWELDEKGDVEHFDVTI